MISVSIHTVGKNRITLYKGDICITIYFVVTAYIYNYVLEISNGSTCIRLWFSRGDKLMKALERILSDKWYEAVANLIGVFNYRTNLKYAAELADLQDGGRIGFEKKLFKRVWFSVIASKSENKACKVIEIINRYNDVFLSKSIIRGFMLKISSYIHAYAITDAIKEARRLTEF